MNARHVFAAACCIALGIAIGQISPSVGQQAAPQPAAAVGRYQMAVGGPATTAFVCDTTTGQCWTRMYVDGGGNRWNSIGSPVDKAKAAK
jgi:hypothetical protein